MKEVHTVDDEIKEFVEQANNEVERFGQDVDAIVKTVENSLKESFNISNYKTYAEYVMSVLERNKTADDDTLERLMSEDEFKKKKEDL